MRVHLKNVVHSAVERGLVIGYHRLQKLPKIKRANSDVMVDTFLKSIWECLDGIIDFTDEDDAPSGEKKDGRTIGFAADAVSDTDVTDPEEDTEDEEDGLLPYDVLHRVHREP
jgi:hypothetical protein